LATFDFAEGATPTGYSIDLIRLIAEKTGLNLSFVNGLSWEELLAKFKNGELDVLPAIYKTDERSSWIAFTSPYNQNPSVLIVEENNSDIKDLASLDGKNLAVIPSYAITQAVEARFPEIIRSPVLNPTEGVLAVANGEVDAFIGSMGVISYVARHNYISNIKIIGEVELRSKEEAELHIGVLKNNIILRNILQKGLDALTPEENDHLHQRWFQVNHFLTVQKTSFRSTLGSSVEFFIYIPPIFLILFLIGYLFVFKKLRLNIMLTLSFIFITSVAITITSTIAYQTAKNSLEEESFNKLTAIREMKADQLEDFFQYISDQVLTFSEDKMIVEAMKNFSQGFKDIDKEMGSSPEDLLKNDFHLKNYYQNQYIKRLNQNIENEATIENYWPGNKKTRLLQQLYISNNHFQTGYKLNLDYAGDSSSYSKTHKKFHPIIRSYLEKFGYYDIFLVEPDSGHIVYSVFKEVDFATSLLNGPYRNTNFAEVFREANSAKVPNKSKIIDYQPYHPSYNAPASFIASPIFDGNEKIGVLVFQMPIDEINEIMTNNLAWSEVGLGASGETYLVGPDYLLRNQSRFFIEDSVNYFNMIRSIGVEPKVIERIKNLNTTIGLQPVRTVGTEDAMAGEAATRIFPDYRGVEVLSAYKPLHLKDLQWAIMSEIDKEEAFAHVYFLRKVVVLCYIIIIFLIVIVVYYFSRHITRPLQQLTNYANVLGRHDFTASRRIASASDEISHITKTANEVGDLARAFQHMETELDGSIKNLMRTTSVKERMEGELNIGHEIQMSMLPLIFPAFPDRREIDVHAGLKPAKEVGGDFYDFYFIDEEHFCFCVGDVSGKGVPAALFMAITKTLIKSRASDDISTASIITQVNDELSSDNPASMFVTFFIGILNIKTGEVLYTNAGHNPPYVKRKTGEVEKLGKRHGLVLGAMDGMTYGEDKVLLAHDDTILLYTDGVTEAMNLDEQLYSDNRLEQLFEVKAFRDSQDLVETIMVSVKDFENGAEQADDITILALKYTHSPDTEKGFQMKLVAKNELSEIDKVNEIFASFAEEHNIPKSITSKVKMVFDELLNNAISFAFQDDKEHEIEINIELREDRLSISLSDDGIPFNPFRTETPDTDLSIEERSIGGLGIHLVQNVMDEVHYKRQGDTNIVTVVKDVRCDDS
jgi:ABC-type amino acid transport substrate-binding protein/anti-sigma regulatory factor (Ser/Thr protein kinase)/HAMP domain-containing protein